MVCSQWPDQETEWPLRHCLSLLGYLELSLSGNLNRLGTRVPGDQVTEDSELAFFFRLLK